MTHRLALQIHHMVKRFIPPKGTNGGDCAKAGSGSATNTVATIRKTMRQEETRRRTTGEFNFLRKNIDWASTDDLMIGH